MQSSPDVNSLAGCSTFSLVMRSVLSYFSLTFTIKPTSFPTKSCRHRPEMETKPSRSMERASHHHKINQMANISMITEMVCHKRWAPVSTQLIRPSINGSMGRMAKWPRMDKLRGIQHLTGIKMALCGIRRENREPRIKRRISSRMSKNENVFRIFLK